MTIDNSMRDVLEEMFATNIREYSNKKELLSLKKEYNDLVKSKNRNLTKNELLNDIKTLEEKIKNYNSDSSFMKRVRNRRKTREMCR